MLRRTLLPFSALLLLFAAPRARAQEEWAPDPALEEAAHVREALAENRTVLVADAAILDRDCRLDVARVADLRAALASAAPYAWWTVIEDPGVRAAGCPVQRLYARVLPGDLARTRLAARALWFLSAMSDARDEAYTPALARALGEGRVKLASEHGSLHVVGAPLMSPAEGRPWRCRHTVTYSDIDRSDSTVVETSVTLLPGRRASVQGFDAGWAVYYELSGRTLYLYSIRPGPVFHDYVVSSRDLDSCLPPAP